jgi:hypothetical protein
LSLTYLRILGLGDVDEDLSGRVDDIEKLHDSGAVVGYGGISLVVMDQLVHPSRSQSGADDVGDGGASTNVTHHLRFPLRSVCALLEQYDLGLLQPLQKQKFSDLSTY